MATSGRGLYRRSLLELHGFDFAASEEDATQSVMAVAAGELDEGAFAAWMRENAKRKR